MTKDPEEDFMRRTLTGDLNYFSRNACFIFYEYLKNVAKLNQNYVFYSALSILVATFLLSILFSCYVIRETFLMRRFYGNLFKLRSCDF